jgi:hypothetical protein
LDPMSKRLSLILDDGDQAAIEPFLRAGTEHYDALLRWAATHGVNSVKTEAAALRVLLRAGAAALREEVLDAGYLQLSVELSSTEEHAELRATRRKHAARPAAAR